MAVKQQGSEKLEAHRFCQW